MKQKKSQNAPDDHESFSDEQHCLARKMLDLSLVLKKISEEINL